MPAIDDTFTATVRDLTSDGAGVVEHESGQVFFVPGVWAGETGRFRVTGFRKRNGFAELVELLDPSPYRVEAPCPHHGFSSRDCGGCPWQFVATAAQLRQKEQRVREAMTRLGAGEKVAPIWASPRTFGYRNRAQFKTDGRALGYVSAKSKQLAPIADCPILTDHNRQTLHQLLEMLPNRAWRTRAQGRGKRPGEPWVTLDIDEEVSVQDLQINRRRPFRQGNEYQNRRMKKWLAERLAAAERGRPALELFAGSGNFTEVVAAAGFPRTIAAEGVEAAVLALESRLLPGVSPRLVDLFDERAVAGLAAANTDAATLVLDPPRDGFRALPTLLAGAPGIGRVIYISCDLATFSRDLAALAGSGFAIDEVQPLDMFPQTPHVEIMAVATIV